MTRQAAIYARQSKTRDGSASLEEQVERCREAAGRMGLEVVAELIEKPSTSGYQGRGRNRAQFKELLEVVRARRVDCVLAYDTDRLSRGGGPGWAPLLEAFEDAGQNLDHAVATPSGWLTEFEIGIRATMDREASKKTSAHMLAVRAREAREGKPRVSGRRPFGYSQDWMSVEPAEAALIREAADRVFRGESVWAIASDWNRRDVATVTGTAWTVNVLVNVLTSGRIAGLREHKGELVAEGAWPAIIDRDSHDRLRAMLRPSKPKPVARSRRYPLVGLLRCSLCGGPLRSSARVGGVRTYACRNGPGLGGCGRIRIKAEPVELYIKELVCGSLADPRTRDVLAALAREEHADADASIGKRIRDIEVRTERLVDLYLDGSITKATYNRRNTDLAAELQAAETLVQDHSRQRTLSSIPRDYDEITATWDSNGADWQRLLIDAVLEPIVVKPAVQGRKQFDPDRLNIIPRA